MKYNKLTIIREYKSKYPGGRPCRRLECLCDCGNICNPEKSKVINGITKSCGCLHIELCKTLGDRVKKKSGEASFNEVFASYKKGAIARNYEFSLSKSEFLEIITKPCIYCGNCLTNKCSHRKTNGHFSYTGIDRYDNNIGYTIENSVPCCKICNRIKTNMGVDMLYEQLNKMLDNSNCWKRTA